MTAEPVPDKVEDPMGKEDQPEKRSTTIGTGSVFAIGCIVVALTVILAGVLLIMIVS